MKNPEQPSPDERVYVRCAFCGEDDFDLYGLKMHLLRWCEDFDNIKEPPERRQAGELKV